VNTMRPRNADDLTPDELASAAIYMDLVLEREPLLKRQWLQISQNPLFAG
jgi:hypothetical protein